MHLFLLGSVVLAELLNWNAADKVLSGRKRWKPINNNKNSLEDFQFIKANIFEENDLKIAKIDRN